MIGYRDTAILSVNASAKNALSALTRRLSTHKVTAASWKHLPAELPWYASRPASSRPFPQKPPLP